MSATVVALGAAGCGSADGGQAPDAGTATAAKAAAKAPSGATDSRRKRELLLVLDVAGYGPGDTRDYVDSVDVSGGDVDVYVRLARGSATHGSFYGLCSALMDVRPWIDRVWLTGSDGKIAATWYRDDDDCDVKG